MKFQLPPNNQGYSYLQTNRSDDLGSLWSTFNLDFQSNLGAMRLAQKLVTNTTSSDDADLGTPVAFEVFDGRWWAICGTRIFKNSSEQLTSSFSEDASKYSVGDSTSQFDVTNPAGTTFRYTFDGTGTDPNINTTTFPTGASVTISGTNLAAGNRGTFAVTGSGANYFEVTNASGVVESNKTINTGSISVTGGSLGTDYDPESVSDLAIFDDRLWATTVDSLYSKVDNGSGTGIWTKRDSLGSTDSHKLVYFKKFNRLYFCDTSSKISSIATDNTVANSTGDYFIDLDTSIGVITTMTSTSSDIWIGTTRVTNSTSVPGINGSILQWDGISGQVTNDYLINAAGVLAMTIINDVPYALDSEGRILKFTGYSFEEIQRLPINRILLVGASLTPSNNKFAVFNGMVSTKNNTLLILVNNLNDDPTDSITENLPSGIWELDLATFNFTHRYSFTQKARTSSTITDYGQNRIFRAGGLKINTLDSDSSNGRSTLICGSGYYTDATTVKYGIFIDSPVSATTDNEGQKRGYFVTTWFNSSEIADKWVRSWLTFRRFLNSNDKIILKYRLNEEEPIEATITWTSTTTFTTTTDVSAYAPEASPFNGTTGGEVEITQGTGGGSCTHISNISENGGTYTVTLDTVVTGVTGTAKARFQKWVKMFPEVTGQVNSYAQIPIGSLTNIRCQIKGVPEWTGDGEFYKMVVVSNEDIKANL